MMEQRAIAFGLALLGAPEHGVELANGFVRHQRVQEHDGVADARQIGEEIAAREAEQRRDVADLGEHRVGAHAFRIVDERDDERNPLGAGRGASGQRASDEVRATLAKEQRSQHLDAEHRVAARDAEAFDERIGDRAGARLRIGIAVGERIVLEHARADVAKIAVDDVDIARDRLGDVRGRLGIERDELDVRGDAAGMKEAARDGIEEGLGELAVEQRLDQRFVCVARRRPQRARTDALVEQELESRRASRPGIRRRDPCARRHRSAPASSCAARTSAWRAA